MKMEDLFVKLKIINDLSKIILKYLTSSHTKLLNGNSQETNMCTIIIYDPKLMVYMKRI